ncbi:MAG: hypothetical protein QM740_08350 [Acidovorax sp.]
MELLTLALVAVVVLQFFKARERRERVALLGGFLRRYQIEKLMENLTDGYLRALGEADAQRSAQIWAILADTEKNLRTQFQSFAADFARVPAQEARVSTLALALPYARRWLPGKSFDMRRLLQVHAQGLAAAVTPEAPETPNERKRRAYTMTAEIYLMQHSCHWFCRSATVASVRLLGQHHTSYEQVLNAVSPATRAAYGQVVNRL